jgi:anti-sigma28 factor (negative regulator of flagellin synthesis)
MRLHLNSAAPTPVDTSQGGAQGVAPGASVVQSGATSTARAQQSSGSQDSIAISGPSSAFNRLTTDRASRVEQVAALVRAGSYQVASSTLSSAIVAHSIS